MKLKQYLKTHMSPEWIDKASKSLFYLHSLEGNFWRKINSFKRTKHPVKIVFLVNGPQTWNSFSRVFEEARFCGMEPQIVVVPSQLSHPSLDVNNDEFDFYKEVDSRAEYSYKDGKWLDLQVLEPDVVFRNTPYDSAYPDEYSMRKMARYTKLCHIPYAFDWSSNIHYKIAYSDSFFLYINTVFTDSRSVDLFCHNRVKSLKHVKGVNIFFSGFPRFELLNKSVRTIGKTARSFLWIPRWSTDNINNNATSFFRYKKLLFSFFDEHQDLELIVRPHQLMFPNFVFNNIMTEQDVEDLKSFVKTKPNISFDTEMDYTKTFQKSDVLIADFSSLIVEFFLTKKPVIYCGEKFQVGKDIEFMVDLFYPGEVWESLKSNIESLSSGDDKLAEDRNRSVEDFWRENNLPSSKMIIDEVTRMCRLDK